MTPRGKLVREKAAGVLVIAVILAAAMLLWGGGPSAGTAAADRIHDDETLERARVGWTQVVPAAAPNDDEARALPETAAEPHDAAARRDDLPLKADIRPAPPPEIFQTRPASPSGAFDTGLVFSNRPPPVDPAKDWRSSRVPPRAPVATVPSNRFAADIRPPAPPEARARRHVERRGDSGLVFSARPLSPPEGLDKYRP